MAMQEIDWKNNETGLDEETMKLFQKYIKEAIDEVSEKITNDVLQKIGGTLEGNLNSQSIVPTETDIYNIGSANKEFNIGHFKRLRFNGGNLIGFKWMGTDLAIEIDNEIRYIPVQNTHPIHFEWTESGLGVYIDNTFVGNVTLTK